MPEVPMVATRDFTYSTRRLKAGDEFSARNQMDARILERVRRVAELGKATYGRKVGNVSPPSPEVAEQARTASQPPAPTHIPTIEEVLKVKVVKPTTAKARPQLDHDGNGKAGGSKKGSTRRKITSRRKAKK